MRLADEIQEGGKKIIPKKKNDTGHKTCQFIGKLRQTLSKLSFFDSLKSGRRHTITVVDFDPKFVKIEVQVQSTKYKLGHVLTNSREKAEWMQNWLIWTQTVPKFVMIQN